jgi:Tfp pilus assembly protein PilX
MGTEAMIQLKDRSGVALVIALIMIVVLTLIGLSSTFTSVFETKLSGTKRESTNAYYATDAAAQAVSTIVETLTLTSDVPITDPPSQLPQSCK